MSIRYSLSEKQKETILTNAWYMCDLLIDYINKYDDPNMKETYIDDVSFAFNKIKELFEDEEKEVPHKPTQAELEEFWADMNEDYYKSLFMKGKNDE